MNEDKPTYNLELTKEELEMVKFLVELEHEHVTGYQSGKAVPPTLKRHFNHTSDLLDGIVYKIKELPTVKIIPTRIANPIIPRPINGMCICGHNIYEHERNSLGLVTQCTIIGCPCKSCASPLGARL